LLFTYAGQVEFGEQAKEDGSFRMRMQNTASRQKNMPYHWHGLNGPAITKQKNVVDNDAFLHGRARIK